MNAYFGVAALTAEAIVMERGRIVHRARSAELAGDHPVLDRYLGLLG